MTLDGAISAFLVAMRLRRLSAHTSRAYAGDLALYRRWSPHGVLADALTPEEIARWREAMDETDLAAASIKRRLAALKAFCKWLEREGHIGTTPFRGLDMAVKLPKRLPRNLGASDLRRLLRHVRAERERAVGTAGGAAPRGGSGRRVGAFGGLGRTCTRRDHRRDEHANTKRLGAQATQRSDHGKSPHG